MSEKIVEKLESIETSLKADVQEQVKTIADAQAKVLDEKVEGLKIEFAEKLVNLEAKFAGAPSVVREFTKSVTQDRGRFMLEQLRDVAKGGTGKIAETYQQVQLWEDEAQYYTYQHERRERQLREASALTGSGSGKGGEVKYNPFTRAKRFENNLRTVGTPVPTSGSDYQWRIKIGDSGLQWGYITNPNSANTTQDTFGVQVQLKDMVSVFPIRVTFLNDTAAGGYESVLMDDMVSESSAFEGLSHAANNDQVGTGATVRSGGVDGLRGLASYAGGNATFTGGTFTNSAYGNTGVVTTSGYHQIATYDQKTSNGFAVGTNTVAYADIVTLVSGVLPLQYRTAANAFMMSAPMISAVRSLVDLQGRPIFIDGLRTMDSYATHNGDGYVGELLGFPVYLNSYMDNPWGTGTAGTVSKYPIWFGDWSESYIVDSMSLVLRRFDQTLPGSITYYMEKRAATQIRQPFAFARLRSTATSAA